ncbi:putative component of NuA3 histone acetyltransferase complex [Malassezia equina]|uniref:uS12 prolyl 3,4-dihydroxylase n=1 Tax=Malassezia equina TaxID=1381935 RepID=A0AAF0EIJ1_9BASI|nr:putative component of NuA3 histone acetyltransferase complex [Malassezia equina]
MVSDVRACFGAHILDDDFVKSKRAEYDANGPYHHSVIQGLINEDLLKRAREEIVEELHFTEKETDIYKVNQTGDLANLDGLPEQEAKRLTALLQVRNALYSDEFRDWVRKITGCGPLSAKKKDMSINDYSHGCHLLNHDDVISTRRVSYILYLPDPATPWTPDFGGSLELYPVKEPHVPESVPSLVVPVQWNQFTFFEVQPGHSFHSVEEVVHPTHSRLSLSGWFHRLQPDEPGFSQEEEDRELQAEREFSSVGSLTSKQFMSPFDEYDEETFGDPPLPGSPLPSEHVRFLSHFLNPAYLTSKIQSTLFEKFGEESHLLLADFLRQDVAEHVENVLRAKDEEDGLVWWMSGAERVGFDTVRIQPHGVGTALAKSPSAEDQRWTLYGPPHRERFATLQSSCTPKNAPAIDYTSKASPLSPMPSSSADLLEILTHQLFPSAAFRHLVANLTQLIPMAARPIRVRRFRPGLDYTLARSDDETVLDLTLTLTPDVIARAKQAVKKTARPQGLAGKKKAPALESLQKGVLSKADKDKLAGMWDRGDIGGWECYLAPHEGEEDPAVYQSAASWRAQREKEAMEGEADAEEADEDEADEDEDDDFDGVLLNVTPAFNTLNVVLRDEGVMRFVKYLGASAGGSRWDISAEYTVGAAEIEEMDEAP